MSWWRIGRASGTSDFIVLPLAFWLVGATLLGDGRVPLGDSWAYSWVAAQLAEHGRVVLHDSQAMTLVGQIFLAYPVAILFSAAPSTLNHLTLVVSAITLDLFLLIYRKLGMGRGLSLLGATTLAANPLWLTQSLAFETELYFLFFAALGVLAFLSWNSRPRTATLWLAGIAFTAAASVRQTAVVFVAGGMLSALRMRSHPRQWIPWFLPLIFLAGFYAVIHATHRVPTAYEWQQEMVGLRWGDPAMLISTTCIALVGASHYLGLFLLPASSVAAAWPRTRQRTIALIATCVLLVAGTLVLYVGYGQSMPYMPNLIQPSVVFTFLQPANIERIFNAAWTGLSLLAAILLLTALIGSPRRGVASSVTTSRQINVFLVVSVGLFLCFNLAIGFAFDRYLLLPLPFLLPLVLRGCTVTNRQLKIGFVLVGVSLAGSIVLVDHRVRTAACLWDTAESLRLGGMEPERINGGVAFNGYYSYRNSSHARAERFAAMLPLVQPDAESLVVLHPMPHLTLLNARPCPTLPGTRRIEAFTYTCEPRKSSEPSTRCQPF